MSEVKFSTMFETGKPMQRVLPLLLKDHTTDKNIVWATDTYAEHGAYYHKDRQMFPDFNINLIMDDILLPRIQKTKEQQQSRTKSKAEVFTPSWICNKMNNFCDEQWFMRKNVFNIENPDNTWTPNEEPVQFGTNRNKKLTEWQRYVDSRRIEITCGEAPYIVSRYDATIGESLDIKMRIGVLDRKLRVVNENTDNESDWFKWVCRAYEATYGFEYQGDNLFFARVNLVQTFIDYYEDRFGTEPKYTQVKKIADIVSWNIWQMDGLNDIVPFGIPDDEFRQMSMFDSNIKTNDKPVYCKIKDWRSNKVIEYRSMKSSE